MLAQGISLVALAGLILILLMAIAVLAVVAAFLISFAKNRHTTGQVLVLLLLGVISLGALSVLVWVGNVAPSQALPAKELQGVLPSPRQGPDSGEAYTSGLAPQNVTPNPQVSPPRPGFDLASTPRAAFDAEQQSRLDAKIPESGRPATGLPVPGTPVFGPINGRYPGSPSFARSMIGPPVGAGSNFHWVATTGTTDQRWQDLNETPFLADVYPAIEMTARPAAVGLCNEMADDDLSPTATDERRRVRLIRVNGKQIPQNHREAIVVAFLDQLRETFPDVTVVRHPSESAAAAAESKLDSDDDGVLEVTLTVETQRTLRAPWSEFVQLLHGNLVAQGEYSNQGFNSDFRVSYQFIESKTWVTDITRFRNENVDRRFAVGYSDEFTSSESQARTNAISLAKSTFRIGRHGQHDVPIIDTFSQKLTRPYGTVWRSAVLLDVSDNVIGPILQAQAARQRFDNRQRLSATTGLLILLGSTALIAVTLNSITQSYFRGTITIIGVVGALTFLLIALGVTLG